MGAVDACPGTTPPVADWLLSLLPPDLPAQGTGLLLAASAVTSFITAAFGAGGGVLLLALMTLFLPATAVIPLHGVIQAGSNAGRTLVTWRHIQWPLVAVFSLGGMAGALAGSGLLVQLRAGWLELALGAFILWSCWAPPLVLRHAGHGRIALGGGVTSLVTLFVGATGPFVAALFRPMGLERRRHVGTFSACMVVQHGLKIGVFGLLGFAFGPYLPFLAGMLVTGFLGTLLGRLTLDRLGDRRFRWMLNAILTLLALHLLYRGAATLWG